MQFRSGNQLRESFLGFFEEKGHRRFPSFSLVPEDPSIMFTIAGMVPFKPYFLGMKVPPVKRATTSQKCVRTNDIENVGRTARHHTFFEMLGNFSFGDYFKKEAIPWAWEFVTERIGLDPDRLTATIYLDDDEAFEIWHRTVGLPEERIVRMGEEDNFWAVGPVGPCGPCSELIYDQGPSFSCGKPDCKVGCSCDRYLEIWNLVFMQFNRDEAGNLVPLPKQNIDTGMGLERLASVVQGVRTDFDTDLFVPLIRHACEMTGHAYGSNPKGDMAVRVISDHIRAISFMIADGILPSNEGRGYVLRRLLRRAVRWGRLLGLQKPFLSGLLPTVIEVMGSHYREIPERQNAIRQVIDFEEAKFGRTLEQGSALIESELRRLADRGETVLPGEVAFELYDTYGFPIELTEEICQDASFTLDRKGFERAMEDQRERARSSSKMASASLSGNVYTELAKTIGQVPFVGYAETRAQATVLALIQDGRPVEELQAGDEAEAVLDRTPFYAEKGGQVGDTGTLSSEIVKARVLDTVSPAAELPVIRIRVEEGLLRKGDTVLAAVDEDRRWDIRRHHTATHLLHEALIHVLGDHVRQAGSLVGPEALRFDFTHFSAVTRDELARVERIVNEQVLRNIPLETLETDLEKAKEMGAKALFSEKYGSRVRVVSVPGFSTELCGGTHCNFTGDIGLFRILREEGIGSGLRRITAQAGRPAYFSQKADHEIVDRLKESLGVHETEHLPERVRALLDELSAARREATDAKLKALLCRAADLAASARQVGKFSVVTGHFEGVDMELLRQLGDSVKNRLKGAVIVFASVGEGKVSLMAMGDELAVSGGFHAGRLVGSIAPLVGGSGGGRPNLAQAGGKSPEKVAEALDAVAGIVENLFAKS
ncbi:MAG: alanine--tRNA ligase [Synergistaceae bacterium]|nr:alanine--tRNA ligase [Synergistaceae bacterium]